jgi:hypothetical protein
MFFFSTLQLYRVAYTKHRVRLAREAQRGGYIMLGDEASFGG